MLEKEKLVIDKDAKITLSKVPGWTYVLYCKHNVKDCAWRKYTVWGRANNPRNSTQMKTSWKW